MSETFRVLTGNGERAREALPNPFVVSENKGALTLEARGATAPETPASLSEEHVVSSNQPADDIEASHSINVTSYKSENSDTNSTNRFLPIDQLNDQEGSNFTNQTDGIYLSEELSTSLIENSETHVEVDSSQKSAALQSPFFDLAFQDDKHVLDSGFDESAYDDEVEDIVSVAHAVSLADSERAVSKSIQGGASLRGIGLLSAVYAELSKQLGDSISTADLLIAAQRLIDLSKNDFVGKEQKTPSERAGYYSWDLVRAFSSSHPWHIAEVESARFDHCDVDEYSPETYQNGELIMQGWNERMWEF